ncbi:NAD(P)H-flavin reductase [Motilimonas pumila]|uniref:NAD(P)H-flavin reductase n=1 Tax=Motilimonas pumila TaxID=2303987 RepID=A0A418YIK7_9GAMM|nr:NAD(P)H-flavin reductase [Motilimonas pumila]RJG50478.1 NAD(P)H-flavin reductase [Motilimonas pumila]
MKAYSGKVVELSQFSDFVYKLVLAFEQDVEFQAGQYLTVVMGEKDKRPFSIASSPLQSRQVELHIGASEHNPYAMEVIEQAKQHGELSVEIAAGKAFYREESKRPVILIAGGTGFSYVKSIIDYCLGIDSQQDIFLYWGGKQAEHLYYRDEIEQWCKQQPKLTYVPVLEQPPQDWSGKTGLVHKAVLQDFVSLEGYDVYIAGRFEMSGAAREDFRKQGIEEAHLYGDAFEFIK